MSTIIGKATSSTAVVAPGNYISCYILNKLNDTLIQFVVIPEDLSESYSANYNTEEIIGRTAPYISYTQSGARTFNYSVKLHRDLVEDFDEVIYQIKLLEYPKYNGSLVQPPYVYVRFGDMLNTMAVVNSVGLSWSGPILDGTETFSTCDVSFDFTELRLKTLPQLGLAQNTFQEGNI